jgi:hypothetical protein
VRSFFLVGLLALTACSQPPPAVPGAHEFGGAPALKIGESTLPQGYVDAVTSQLPPEHMERMKADGQYEGFLRQMAQGNLLYERALAEKLHEDPAVKARLAVAVRSALAQEVLRRTADGAATEEALKAMYEKQAARYRRDERKVRQIRVKDEATAATVLTKLQEGGDFAALASEFSDDVASAARGGDMGWVERRRLPPELGEAVFTTEVGARGGPVVTPRGVFVFEVQEARSERPLDEVRAELEQAVKQEAVGAMFEALEKDHPFQLIDPNAPAAPAGAPAEGAPAAAPGEAAAPAGH